MTTTEMDAPRRLAESESARQLVEGWAESLAQVFESMAGERPAIRWQPTAGPPGPETGPENEILWWEQPFVLAADMSAWVGATQRAWEYAGALTLKAAGLETVDPGEARNTWLEILGQSLSAMARSIGAAVGREVSCAAGAERHPGPNISDYAAVTMQFAGSDAFQLTLALSPEVLALVAAPSAKAEESGPPAEEPRETAPPPAHSRTMDLLLEIELPVSISFGKIDLPMRDVLKLTTGSIVELDRDVNEPVEILVNRRLIARGEVVVVEGNYGVRIQQIASRPDRLRSVR